MFFNSIYHNGSKLRIMPIHPNPFTTYNFNMVICKGRLLTAPLHFLWKSLFFPYLSEEVLHKRVAYINWSCQESCQKGKTGKILICQSMNMIKIQIRSIDRVSPLQSVNKKGSSTSTGTTKCQAENVSGRHYVN